MCVKPNFGNEYIKNADYCPGFDEPFCHSLNGTTEPDGKCRYCVFPQYNNVVVDQKAQQQVTTNNLVADIGDLGHEWELSFEMKLTGGVATRGNENIINLIQWHERIGRGWKILFDLDVLKGTDVSQNTTVDISYTRVAYEPAISRNVSVTSNEWNSFLITCKKQTNSQFLFFVSVNGVKQLIPGGFYHIPMQFHNVRLYASDNWGSQDKNVTGYLRNIKLIETLDNYIGKIIFFGVHCIV